MILSSGLIRNYLRSLDLNGDERELKDSTYFVHWFCNFDSSIPPRWLQQNSYIGRQVHRKPRRTPRLQPTILQLRSSSSALKALHCLAARPRPPQGPLKIASWLGESWETVSSMMSSSTARATVAKKKAIVTKKANLNILFWVCWKA